MSTPAEARVPAPAHAGMVAQVLSQFLDIESVWCIDQQPGDCEAAANPARLLAFADATTLRRLRASEHLHVPGIEFLVVTNGDEFASAWGPGRLSGSLARWAWRQTSPREAFYDEARWSGSDGGVMRVRRKAFLLWRR